MRFLARRPPVPLLAERTPTRTNSARRRESHRSQMKISERGAPFLDAVRAVTPKARPRGLIIELAPCRRGRIRWSLRADQKARGILGRAPLRAPAGDTTTTWRIEILLRYYLTTRTQR